GDHVRTDPTICQVRLVALICGLALGCSGGADANSQTGADGGLAPDASTADGATAPPCTPASMPSMQNIIPKPVSITETGMAFCLSATLRIEVAPDTPELRSIGQYLANRLHPATGYLIQVGKASGGEPASGDIRITTEGADPALGEEGYL